MGGIQPAPPTKPSSWRPFLDLLATSSRRLGPLRSVVSSLGLLSKTASGLQNALPKGDGHIILLASSAAPPLRQLVTCSLNAASPGASGRPRLLGCLVQTSSTAWEREGLKSWTIGWPFRRPPPPLLKAYVQPLRLSLGRSGKRGTSGCSIINPPCRRWSCIGSGKPERTGFSPELQAWRNF